MYCIVKSVIPNDSPGQGIATCHSIGIMHVLGMIKFAMSNLRWLNCVYICRIYLILMSYTLVCRANVTQCMEIIHRSALFYLAQWVGMIFIGGFHIWFICTMHIVKSRNSITKCLLLQCTMLVPQSEYLGTCTSSQRWQQCMETICIRECTSIEIYHQSLAIYHFLSLFKRFLSPRCSGSVACIFHYGDCPSFSTSNIPHLPLTHSPTHPGDAHDCDDDAAKWNGPLTRD